VIRLTWWLLTFLALSIPGLAKAQVPANITGTWTVDVNDGNRTRTMVVSEDQNALRVLFGIAGEKLYPIPAKVSERGELTATTLFGSVMVFDSKGADRLEGSFTTKAGKVFVAQASRAEAPRAEAQESGQQARAVAPTVHFIHMGGNDCPPCVFWRITELPKLQALPEFQRIRFTYVTKTIASAIPPRFFLPEEVKPYKDILDVANASTPGSPQAAIVVDGKVYDFYWGTRSAEEIEAMLKSIRTGSKYPFARCLQMAPESRKCGVRG